MAKAREKEAKVKAAKQKQAPTKKQLDDAVAAIAVLVDGQQVVGSKKEFSSGSVGWNANGKVVIGGLTCQVSCNVVIVGSKPEK